MDPQGLSLLVLCMGKLTFSLSNDMGRDSIVVLMLNSTSPALIVLPQPRLFQALQGGFHDGTPGTLLLWLWAHGQGPTEGISTFPHPPALSLEQEGLQTAGVEDCQIFWSTSICFHFHVTLLGLKEEAAEILVFLLSLKTALNNNFWRTPLALEMNFLYSLKALPALYWEGGMRTEGRLWFIWGALNGHLQLTTECISCCK